MDINTKVFCFDPTTKNIFEATVVGTQISGGEETSRGYLMIALMQSNGKKRFLESAHVHASKESAEAHKERVTPIMATIDQLGEAFTKKANEARIFVIGEPLYTDLATKIQGKSNGQ